MLDYMFFLGTNIDEREAIYLKQSLQNISFIDGKNKIKHSHFSILCP